MMTLIYSPFFDRQVWMGQAEAGSAVLGRKYVGRSGLLEELELRLGLARPEGCAEGRLAKWYKALREADAQDPSLFFHDSFQNDPAGTAKMLLRWRDALVGAGWKNSGFYHEDGEALRSYGLALNDSRTVSGLAAVERKFESEIALHPGIPDRWMAVYEELSKGRDLPPGISIRVAGTEAALQAGDPLLYRILSLMSVNRVNENRESESRVNENRESESRVNENRESENQVNESRVNENQVSENRAVRVNYDARIEENPAQNRILLEARDTLEACQWLLAGDYRRRFPDLHQAVQAGQVLICCEDASFLNGVLASLGRPAVADSGMEVNNATVGLFKNGIGQFRLPVDLKGLVNYLSSPYHPLNLFKKTRTDGKGDTYELTLKSALKKYLSLQHGFGLSHGNETWDGLLGSADFKADSDTPFAPADLTGFWNTRVTRVDHNGVCVVETQAVKDYCARMAAWCRTARTADSAAREQLRLVGSFFDSLKEILELENAPSIPWPELAKKTAAISAPAPYHRRGEALGGLSSVSEPAAVAERLDRPLVWLDACEKDGRPYEYDFLIRSSIEAMNKNKMCIPSAEAVEKSRDEAERRGLSMAGTVYAIWPHKDSGRLCRKHRFFTLARQNACNVTSLERWSLEKPVVRGIGETDTRREQYDDVHAITEEMFPAKESASSLEVLFNNPFLYVMRYLFKIREPDSTRLSTLKGLAAHLLIYEAFEEVTAGKGRKEMSGQELMAWCSVDFEKKLGRAVMAEGAELLLSENRSEFVSFKTTLQKTSLPVLMEIMKDHGLVMVGSEFKFGDQVYLTDPASRKRLCELAGSIDCILRDGQGRPVLFDFKWTESKTALLSREEEVKEDNALQLCVYRHALEQTLARQPLEGIPTGAGVRGSGYYMLGQGRLITACDLFQPAAHISYHPVNVNDTNLLQRICNLYSFRKGQLLSGVVEEAEGIPDPHIEYMTEIQACPDRLFHIKGLKRTKSGWSLAKDSIYNAYAAMRGNLK